MKKGTIIALSIGVLVIGGMIVWGVKESRTPGELDQFAQCIADNGAEFYGAWWCPHCQNQKKLFGKSAKLLPYTECSSADGKSQLPICDQKGVEGYPTWFFADGSKQSGEVSLATLSEKTGCTLPVTE